MEANDTAKTIKRLEPGTILRSSWGYEQTNVDFYQVIRRTAKCVTIRRIRSATAEFSGAMAGKCIPLPNEYNGQPERKKILETGGDEFVRIESYAYAHIWNGLPADFTSYA